METIGELSTFNYLDCCRLCLGKDRASVPIFDDEFLLQKIATCRLPVKVSRDDKLPKKICEECVTNIEKSYQFWNTTLNAERQLQQLVCDDGLSDKLMHEIDLLNLDLILNDQSDNRFDATDLEASEQQNINDLINNLSFTIPSSAASNEQFSSGDLAINNTFSALAEEKEQTQCKESVPPGHKVLEIEKNGLKQTVYNNGMVELTVLEASATPNLSSCTESMPNTSAFFGEIETSASFLDQITNSSCGQNAALYLNQFSESISNESSDLHKFPDPELIADSELFPTPTTEAELISCSIPEPVLIGHTDTSPASMPPPLPFGEPIPSQSTSSQSIPSQPISSQSILSQPTLGVKNSMQLIEEGPKKGKGRRPRKKHICTTCMAEFTDKIKLGEHQKKVHKIKCPFTCDLCGEEFCSNLSVYRHRRSHLDGPKRFACTRCDYSTNQGSNLRSHVERRHERLYKFVCEICQRGYMQRSKFEEHQQMHVSGNVGHACKSCKRVFRYRRNLRQHLIGNHPETVSWRIEPKRRIPCPQCNRLFAKELSLARHVKSQHSEPHKKLPCEECGALLSCKSALTQHKRSHRGEKVAVCNDCGKGFSKWQNLRVHQRMHTGERPYKCTYCTKAFAQRTTLVHHIRTHTGERPYKCEQCGKGFISGSLLRKHAAKCPNAIKVPDVETLKEVLDESMPKLGTENES